MNARVPSARLLRPFALGIALSYVAAGVVVPCLAQGQGTQKTPTELERSLATANSETEVVGPRDVVVIANAGAVQAIPALEAQFKRATDVDTKLSIASGLVKLKDHDNAYWNFLLQQATIAVDSDIPDSAYSESKEEMTSEAPPEMQTWAAAHKVPVDTAWKYSRYDIPGKVLQFATTGDPRGIPLLQRALLCRNYLIVAWAANGLALVQDKWSIPLIIAAVQRAPAGYNSQIALSLIYFDDAQAQSAVDKYVPKDWAKAFRDARAQGMGPFGR